ncbi:hypothetical protein F7725_009403 [Dissostichus mawsoni]|uniref:HAT C-terminal dimerisation domain-containing protein n=1 Tax=Dissostichus mawsoni TaxID=36200 RepID=A0A7J5XKM1_DISMA|nr:hypothetical protein F7725_009403 [Dissostichus mawsoni]
MLKILSMLVCYYHADLRKVIVEHLGSLEIVKVNAASLEKVLCEFFEKKTSRGITCEYADGLVMATYAMMPAYRVLYYGFLSTADKELYREPLELMYTKYHVNQGEEPVSRWFRRNSTGKEEYVLCFTGMTPQGRERKKRVCQKLWHEETTTVLRLSIYMGLLAILKEYVMVFQGSQTLVHKLHDRQLELFLAFMACFVKAEHITQLSPSALREMVLEDHMLLPSKEVYVGQEADTFRSQNPNHALLVPFLADVRKAYITTAVYLQKKLPLASPTLTALSALDPLLRGHSQATIQLKRLSGMLRHLLPADQDIQRELVRFNVDLTIPSFKEGESIVEWWGHVFDKPDKYPSLSAMVKCCLSIFHGPRVESSFSLMNEVIDQRSGNMNVPTFNAIQTVKYTLQSRGKTAVQLFRREDVKFGEVDRTLCKNINSAAATYKRQQKMNQKEKQQQQSKYGSQASGSAQQAKKQTAEEEKRARLRHVAKQRKRAMETLVVQAKKKK